MLLRKDKESRVKCGDGGPEAGNGVRKRFGAKVELRPRKEPLVLPRGSKSAVSAGSVPVLSGCQDA